MRFLDLRLINLLSHKNTAIPLHSIIAACIQGPNGAGKSAILDGILFALFGETSRGKDELVKLGEDEATVILDFEQAGLIYKVIRKQSIVGRGKNIVELFIRNNEGGDDQWETIATGTAAKDMILKIIGRDFKTFTSSSFLLQGQGERLINAKPSDRYKIIFDILGLDKYEKYKKKAHSEKRLLEGKRSVMLESIASLVAKSESITEFEARLKESEAELERTGKLIKEQDEELSKMSSEFAVVENKLKEYESIKAEIKGLEERKEKLELERSALTNKQYSGDPDFIELVEAKAESLLSEDNATQVIANEIAGLEASLKAIDEIDKEIVQAESRKEELEKSLKDSEEHLLRYRKIIDNREKILGYVKEEAEKKKSLAELSKEQGRLQAESTRLGKEAIKATEIEAEIAKIEASEKALLKERENALNSETAKLEEARKESSLLDTIPCHGEGDYASCALIEKAVESRKNIDGLEKAIEELKKPVTTDESKKIEELSKTLDALKKDDIQSAIETHNKRSEEIRKEVSDIDKQLEVIATWTKQATEIETAEIEIGRASKAEVSVKKDLESFKGRISDLLKKRGSIQSLEKEHAIAIGAAEMIKASRDIKRLDDEIKAVAGEISRIIKTAGNVEELESRKIKLNHDITLQRSGIEGHRADERDILKEVARVRSEIDQCNKALEESKGVKKSIKDIECNIRIYGILEDAYERIPFYILDNVIEIMQDEANRVLEEISNTGMRIEFRTEKQNKTNKNIKDTLDIVVSDIAGERSIEKFSGGEKTRSTLAITVGLASLSARKAGVKIEAIAIDEPAGLDSQGLIDFGNMFIKLVENDVFNQGILMAHDDKLKDIFDQKIVVNKEGDTSVIDMAA